MLFEFPSQASNAVQAVAAATAAAAPQQSLPSIGAVLGGKPLSPAMMNGIVAKFNPRRAAGLQGQPAANGKLTQAQMNSYKQAANTGSIEQVNKGLRVPAHCIRWSGIAVWGVLRTGNRCYVGC